MRYAVIYSSVTGNTAKVAEAIHRIMPEGTEIFRVNEAPAPELFDFIALGFWADRGRPDKAMLSYMGKVHGLNKTLALFGTMGAWPDSDHARKFMENAALAVEGNIVAGTFACMGRVNPRVTDGMAKMKNSRHPDTPERRARLAEAEKHPDEADLLAAREKFKTIFSLISGLKKE